MNSKLNFVDERFELISVIFRLAGNWEYNLGAGGLDGVEYPFPDEQRTALAKCEATNGYQLEVAKTFMPYIKHEAVLCAKSLGLGFTFVFKFAMHIEKNGEQFAFISDTGSLFDMGEWDEKKAEKFLPLLNKFYKDTDYAGFYAAHMPYYEELSQKFYDNYYHTVDLDWFGKYVDVAHLRCVLSPSNTTTNYGLMVNEKIACALVRLTSGSSLIHEYCHSFANPLAAKWYEENETFRKWCEDSVSAEMPYYSDGLEMAYEYVTHAYHVLYEFQHGGDWQKALVSIKNAAFENTFPYIEEIYEMVMALEE
jgi:hypothetical protein